MSADVHVEVSRARGFGVISSKITSSELTRLKRSRFGNKNFLSSFVEYYLKKSQNMKKNRYVERRVGGEQGLKEP
jgi:hypothetical protein